MAKKTFSKQPKKKNLPNVKPAQPAVVQQPTCSQSQPQTEQQSQQSSCK
ncbi:MAG: hypothetical protein KKB82_09295 [Candidatus Omnitrophica bacterium]|nr:hypothetical protein [Candidatus Omnitrophota bacterium]MBU1926099.1 hypothetical protein [Candidatus Omnitrophota bacterium]